MGVGESAQPTINLFFSLKVCDLLDLLGGTDTLPQASPALSSTAPDSVNNSAGVGGDLLDLLGGLDLMNDKLDPAPGKTHTRACEWGTGKLAAFIVCVIHRFYLCVTHLYLCLFTSA